MTHDELTVTDAVPQSDKDALRELGKRRGAIAALPVNAERRRLWQAVNELRSERPMVWIFEQPWNEFPPGELQPTCAHPLCRQIETQFRKELYQWHTMQADMIMPPAVEVPPALHDTGFGIGEQVDVARTDPTSSIVSRHYHIQIKDEADVEKIKMPVITLDQAEWDRRFDVLSDVFNGVLPVEKAGVTGTSVSAWDLLVRLTGVEEILMDIHMRPAYVHRLMERLAAAYDRRIEQWEELNVLGLNNHRWVGGGYQYTDELPQPDFDPDRVRPVDMWGRSMAQIFSAVSPAAHEEFALQYECRWLNRFGLAYYGCCEPLDKKMDILRKHIPNLRKVSMSPWIDLDTAIEGVGTDLVFSWKPNPAMVAEESWNEDHVRSEIRTTLERLRGMHVEIILKDISTVRHDPQRLTEWSRIAVEEAERADS